jgi:hypothetical protein
MIETWVLVIVWSLIFLIGFFIRLKIAILQHKLNNEFPDLPEKENNKE